MRVFVSARVDRLLVGGLRALDVAFMAQQVAQVRHRLDTARLCAAPIVGGQRPEHRSRYRRGILKRIADQIFERTLRGLPIGITRQGSQLLVEVVLPDPVSEDQPEQLDADGRRLVCIRRCARRQGVCTKTAKRGPHVMGSVVRQRDSFIFHAGQSNQGLAPRRTGRIARQNCVRNRDRACVATGVGKSPLPVLLATLVAHVCPVAGRLGDQP